MEVSRRVLSMKRSLFVKVKIPDGTDAMNYLDEHHARSVRKIMRYFLTAMDKTNVHLCTQSGVATVCGCSRPTAQRAMNVLRDLYFIRWRKIAGGLMVELNSQIATKCSRRVELSNTGYELWSCNLLIKKSDVPPPMEPITLL